MAERFKFTITKIPDGDGRHTEFQEMPISPDQMKILPPNLVERCTTEILRPAYMCSIALATNTTSSYHFLCTDFAAHDDYTYVNGAMDQHGGAMRYEVR